MVHRGPQDVLKENSIGWGRSTIPYPELLGGQMCFRTQKFSIL